MNFGNLTSDGNSTNSSSQIISTNIPLDIFIFIDEIATYGKAGYVYNNNDIFTRMIRYDTALQNDAARTIILEKVNQNMDFEVFKNFCINVGFFDSDSAVGIDSIESAIKSPVYLRTLVDSRDDPIASNFLESILANDTYRGWLDSIAETRSATQDGISIHEQCKPLSVPAIVTNLSTYGAYYSPSSNNVVVNGQTYNMPYGTGGSSYGVGGTTKPVYQLITNALDISFSGVSRYNYDSDFSRYSYIRADACYVYL